MRKTFLVIQMNTTKTNIVKYKNAYGLGDERVMHTKRENSHQNSRTMLKYELI